MDTECLFWQLISVKCPGLSLFARLLLTTIANSVPSERAWSTMDYFKGDEWIYIMGAIGNYEVTRPARREALGTAP
jgi:hypothetical protein